MTSSVGVVPPLVLPNPDGYAAVQDKVTVAAVAAADDDPDAVEVSIEDGTQTSSDATPVPLATILVPQEATVRYLPQARSLTGPTGTPWATPAGPFEHDAWVIDALGDRAQLAPLLPAGVPAPAYWVLDGVDPLSVDDPRNPGSGLLDRWLTDGAASGVHPRARQCHRRTPRDLRAGDADQTWKQRILDGSWAELLRAGTALGLAVSAGTGRTLRIWAFDADGTPLPAAGILAAFATVDPVLLAPHPVVVGCIGPAAAAPVRFYLRFDVWDAILSSTDDPKGGVRSIPPDTVTLKDMASGASIPNTAWTPTPTSAGAGVLVAQAGDVRGKTFTIEADFTFAEPLALSRADANQVFPVGWRLNWSSNGWMARDGTPGAWTNYQGVLVGTRTTPLAFWAGTKVRLAAKFQQPRVDWFDKSRSLTPGPGYTISHVDTRPVAAGHSLDLIQNGTPVGTFTTDDDGEVSGVSFQPASGSAVFVNLSTFVNVTAVGPAPTAVATRLMAEDASKIPAKSVITDTALTAFKARSARIPLSFPALSGPIGATSGPASFVVDADKHTFAAGNTPFAAVFHALKCMKLTQDAVTLLQGDSVDMPRDHRIVATANSPVGTMTAPVALGGRPDHSTTFLDRDAGWFCSNVACHEYGHAIAMWKGTAPTDPSVFAAYGAGITATQNRMLAERGFTGHSAGWLTNSGVALDEGIGEFFELLMGYYPRFSSGDTTLACVATAAAVPGERYASTSRNGSTVTRLSDVSSANVRAVEGAFAMALYEYLRDRTGFQGFPIDVGPVASRQQPAGSYFDAWRTVDPGNETALHDAFGWITTAMATLYRAPLTWTGQWPTPASGGPAPVGYPTVEDYLTALLSADPITYQHLLDDYLVPWNLA